VKPTEITVMRAVRYEGIGSWFDGALVCPARVTGALPVVLIVPGWEGRSTAQDGVAADMARSGCAAFCVDVYGGGKRGATPAECAELMTPLLADRANLRARLLSAITAAQACPEIDPQRIAAIGFCFGGLCVLDLARANAPLTVVATFHGLFTPLPPPLVTAARIDAKVIAFHGWDDPLATPSDVVALARELTAAEADWQIHVYGATMHAFTNREANSPEAGLQYDRRTAGRAWSTLRTLLRDAFNGPLDMQ
jgi:dienelactone hydrolase